MKNKTPSLPKARWLILCIAACLVLAAALALPRISGGEEEPSYGEPAGGNDGRYFELNGRTYGRPGRASDITNELPEGFSLAGQITVAGEEVPYYTNPETPQLLYIRTTVTTNGEVDPTGHIVRTEPHLGYILYAEDGLYHRDLISYNGKLFLSMWSAVSYGEDPDVPDAFYTYVQETYDLTTDSLPEGFVSVGTAEFSGFNTIPTGPLSFNGRIGSNEAPIEVFANSAADDVIFAAVVSSPTRPSSSGEYDTFIRCDKVTSP